MIVYRLYRSKLAFFRTNEPCLFTRHFHRSEEHTSELQSQFHLLFPPLFLNHPPPPDPSPLPLPDALPIYMIVYRLYRSKLAFFRTNEPCLFTRHFHVPWQIIYIIKGNKTPTAFNQCPHTSSEGSIFADIFKFFPYVSNTCADAFLNPYFNIVCLCRF